MCRQRRHEWKIERKIERKFERRSLLNIELVSTQDQLAEHAQRADLAEKGCRFERRSLSNIEMISAEAEMGYKYVKNMSVNIKNNNFDINTIHSGCILNLCSE